MKQRFYVELKKHNAHKRFKMNLTFELFARFERLTKSFEDMHAFKVKKLARLIKHVFEIEHDNRVLLAKSTRYCVSCSLVDREVKRLDIRKSLQELSINNMVAKQRRYKISRDSYECKLCNIAICKRKDC